MRKLLLAATAVAGIVALPGLASAQVYSTDPYAPNTIVINPPAVVTSPMT